MWGRQMSNVLVTGGSGFIGSAVARYLAERGFHVKTLDVLPQPSQLRELNIPHSICDLAEYDTLKDCIHDIDLVVHSAIVQIPRINQERRESFAVNVVGTENICRIVDSVRCRGLILTGSWHVVGESGLSGVITEGFGYRPDKVEDRARLYALSKISQELIVRLYGEFSDKVFGVLRLGTVLGDGMPSDTAASIFIDQAVRGQDLTPFRHSMHRPIVYVSIRDVLEGFHRFSKMILSGQYAASNSSLTNIANLLNPEPVTVLELAKMVRDIVKRISGGKLKPGIRIVDRGLPSLFDEIDKKRVKFDVRRCRELLGFKDFISPADEIEAMLERRLTTADPTAG